MSFLQDYWEVQIRQGAEVRLNANNPGRPEPQFGNVVSTAVEVDSEAGAIFIRVLDVYGVEHRVPVEDDGYTCDSISVMEQDEGNPLIPAYEPSRHFLFTIPVGDTEVSVEVTGTTVTIGAGSAADKSDGWAEVITFESVIDAEDAYFVVAMPEIQSRRPAATAEVLANRILKAVREFSAATVV